MTVRRLGQVLGLFALLAGLNLAFTFENAWPTPWVRPALAVSAELALVVLALALWLERGARPGKGLVRLLAAGLLLVVLGRYADVTAPALFGRPINLYWDARHLPAVVAMTAEVARPAWVFAFAVGMLVLPGLLWVAARGLAAGLLRAMADPPLRRIAAVLAVGAVGLVALGRLGVVPEHWVSRPVTAVYARQAGVLLQAAGWAGVRSLPAARPVQSDLGRLGGGDLFVIFIESYGAAVLDQPAYAEALAPASARLAGALARSGRQAVSARVRSPTFGGESWLAHASLLAGVEVTDQGEYERLLASGQETLVHRLRGAGYRAIALMPGLRKPWPEGAFYGFDRVYDAPSLDYRGPAFGWWEIPDQWSLACLHDREVRPSPRAPLLVVFATMSSHFPFIPLAPYAPDWDALCGPVPYASSPDLAERLAETPDWGAMGGPYVRAVDASLTWLAGYLEGPAPADAVFVVLGDHQPAARVSGPNASRDVPVHVIGRPGPILEALRASGFQPGLTPSAETVGAMPQVRDALLRSLHGG